MISCLIRRGGPGAYINVACAFHDHRRELHDPAVRRRRRRRPSRISSASPRARRSGPIPRPARRRTRPFYDGLDLPPRHRGLHDPGRRSARHRHRRPRLQVRRRVPPERCATARPGILSMANAGPEHQRQPVLHHARRRRRGSTTSTASSAKSSRAWTSSRRSAARRRASPAIVPLKPIAIETVEIRRS